MATYKLHFTEQLGIFLKPSAPIHVTFFSYPK